MKHQTKPNNTSPHVPRAPQVDNYVPDVRRLKSNEWPGVLQQEAKLAEMFSTYITQPLADGAEEAPLPGSPGAQQPRTGGWQLGGWLPEGQGASGPNAAGRRRWAVIAAGVALSAALGLALYYRAARRPRQRLGGLLGWL
jgi:hypothetical protein